MLENNLKAHVKHGEQALLQYRYIQPKAYGQTYLLELTFDKAVVQKWLAEARIKPWPLARPVVLVWATIDEVPEGIEASQQSLHSQFEQHAQRYGLPLQFPIMDIDEISEFSVKDIIFTNQQNLKVLSKRYQSDILLTAHLSYQFSSDEWVCNWALLIGDDIKHWQSRNSDLDKLIADAVKQSTVHVATADLDLSNQHWVTVKVRDIRSSQDTNRVLDYLRTLSYVSDVEIKSLHDNEVQYQISFTTDLSKLKSDIDNGSFLQPAAMSSSSEELLYDYVS